MKYLLIILCVTSPFVHSKTVSKRKMDDVLARLATLEQRVTQLEQVVSQKSQKKMTELKTKDYQNKKIDSEQNRSSASSNFPSPSVGNNAADPSEAQKKEIMEQLEKFKQKSGERQEFLDKLLNED